MNKETKEHFVKKLLYNHLMWSGTNDRKPSEIDSNIPCEYVQIRIEEFFGSMRQFYSNPEETQESFAAEYREEFEEIEHEADKRWAKALEVMGL